MKHPASHLAAIIAAAFVLCSCAPRQAAFDEAAFAPYGGSGSGAVTGRAFRVDAVNGVWYESHRGTVKLMPANAYTTEVVQRHYLGGQRLAKPDPRFAKYVRKVHPDDDGNFAFYHLPPGDYYASFHATFRYPTTSVNSEGAAVDVDADDDQWIYAPVSVKNGQVSKIDSWNQGK